MPNQVHSRAVDVLLVEGTCSASSSCLCPDLIFPFPSLGAFQQFTYFHQQRASGHRFVDESCPRIENSVLHNCLLRVSGHKKDFYARAKTLQLIGHILATHPGHHHVREQKIDWPLLLSRYVQSFASTRGIQDGVSVLLEQFPGRHPDARFVLHEDLVAWIIPKDALSSCFSTQGIT